MKTRNLDSKTSRYLVLLAAALSLLALLLPLGFVSASPQERPRRAAQRSSVPAGSPTGTAPNPASQETPKPSPQSTPAPTPARTQGRIAPELGEPPPPPVLKPKPTPTPESEEVDPESVLKINTELVTLNVRVIDRNNHPIDNLRQDDFHVFEDGVLQPVEFFTREEVPISYGMAIDTSGSLRTQLPSVIEAAKTIINSNKRGDETFLVRFISSDNIETIQDFTEDRDQLLDALDNLYVEGGQTAIIDAVYLSAEHVAEYKKRDESDRRRRALLVITDGEDRSSFYKQDQLFSRLREEDVQIYVIGFVNELDKEGGFIRKSPRDRAVNLINRLATETGGRAFFPQSISELPDIAREIVRDLRTQYVVSYNPTNRERDGSYRAIKVTVADGAGQEKRIALTRSGRTAPKGPAPTPKAPVKRPATGASNKP
jgi:Ca-activated chloride channel homolog